MSVVIDGTSGVTTPAETVQGALTTTGNTILGDASTDTLNVGNGGLVKDASGNVGIGTASPAAKLDVFSSSVGVMKFTGGVGSKSGWLYSDSAGVALSDTAGFTKNGLYINNTSNYVAVYTGSTGAERMRIDSSGNVLVGTTSSTGLQDGNSLVLNEAGISYFNTQNGNNAISVNQTFSDSISRGQIYFYRNEAGPVGTITSTNTATAYNTSSDYRLKENITPMTGALEKVAQLKPVTYDWKIGGSSQGFIAHELQAVVPDCVTGEKDAVDEEGKPVHQGIDTSFLVATLTAAIQEQQALIIQLQADVAALKALSA